MRRFSSLFCDNRPENPCSEIRGGGRLAQRYLPHDTIHILNFQGEVGGASTVKEWTDDRDRKLYRGFPYAKWTQGIDEAIVVTEPGIV